MRPDRALIAILLLMALPWSPARADLIISSPTFTAAAGTSGTFEVLVTNTDTNPNDAPINLSTFSTRITVDPNTGVTFTDITAATTPDQFLFASVMHDPLQASDGNDPNSPPAPLPVDSPFPQPVTSLSFSDSTTADPATFMLPSVPVGPGQSYALALIGYSISPSAATTSPVQVALTIDPTAADGGGSDLTGPTSDSLITGVSSGTLTVRSVPEPSALMLAAVGGLPLLAGAAWRSRSSRHPSGSPQDR